MLYEKTPFRRRLRFPWRLAPPTVAACLTLAAGLALAAGLTGCGQGKGAATENGAARAAEAPAEGSPGKFVEVADAAGLRYAWRIPGKRPLNILQTIGNGAAFLDYNNDGNLDVLLVGPKLGLFQGDGKGRFTDVSAVTGLSKLSGQFLGCAVGDVDGDGFSDVYVSGYRTGLLLRNDGGEVFRDISAAAGLKPQPWGTSCAFAETVPGSGRLDLYVGNYVVFGPDTEPQLCNESGYMTSCGPRHYEPVRGVLYRRSGDGLRFENATTAVGMQSASGKALGVAFGVFTENNVPGLAIANDEMAGDLLEPARRDARTVFRNVGETSGTAYDRDGNVHGGMGVDWGDYNNDGKLDLFVATFQNEVKSLYRNEGSGLFSDVALAAGIGAPATPYVAFGCKFLDFDNDGWLDLALANGHVQDNIQDIDPAARYRQPTLLFRNNGGDPLRYEDVSQAAGIAGAHPIVGRGLATGDYDNDGRVDFLVTSAEGAPLLFHNETARAGHWLGVRLVGTKSNRDGYGAILTATIGTRTQTRQCRSDGSYLSASDKRVHFGLGAAERVDTLTVRWPSGRTDTYANLPADRYLTLREGATAPEG